MRSIFAICCLAASLSLACSTNQKAPAKHSPVAPSQDPNSDPASQNTKPAATTSTSAQGNPPSKSSATAAEPGKEVVSADHKTFLQKNASIKLTGSPSADELKRLATVSDKVAKAAALAQSTTGTVERVSLDNEAGYLVYSIDVRSGQTTQDVKIDAGSGKFLYVDATTDQK